MEENGFFEYTVTFWDDFDKKMKIKHGVTYAESYSDALYNIEQYYEHVENVYIQGLEPMSCYCFEDDSVIFNLSFSEKER